MFAIRFLLVPALLTVSWTALACGPTGNLVVNCAFDVDISGYQAQDGGDLIAHESGSGNLAPGAMRVTDGPLDGNSEAEAEACVNLAGGRIYYVSASFLGVAAQSCLLGWDEFEGPDCTVANGVFETTASTTVNDQSYSTLVGELPASALVQSVELVILCALPSGEAEFLVDDISIVALEKLFGDRFESAQ